MAIVMLALHLTICERIRFTQAKLSRFEILTFKIKTTTSPKKLLDDFLWLTKTNGGYRKPFYCVHQKTIHTDTYTHPHKYTHTYIRTHAHTPTIAISDNGTR